MDTRSALLDSGERLARQRGYDGFSYADLAREVGIRKASIHHHFPTKADLALALVERYRRRFVKALEAVSDRQLDGGGRLMAYIDIYRAALTGGETVCLCVALSRGRDRLSDAVLGELSVFDQVSIGWLTEVFRLGAEDGTIKGVGDPEDEAIACLALAAGAQTLARSARDVARFDAATRVLQRRVN